MSAALQKGAALPCDMERLVEVGRRHGVAVIEVAACAIGSETLWNGEWQKIGKPHGDVSCFSFHPLKLVSTGDGGMLTTQNPEWDAQFRLLRQHAMSVPTTVRYGSTQVIFESYPTVGFNYRMTDIQAAVGREQLKRLPAILQQRRRLAARYADLARGHSRSGISRASHRGRARIGRATASACPRALISAASCRRCSTRQSARAGASCAATASPPTPNCRCARNCRWSEQAQDECILLPLYAQMSDREQLEVVDALREAVLRR